MTCCDAGSVRLEFIEIAPRRGYAGDICGTPKTPDSPWVDTKGETMGRTSRSKTGGIKRNQWESWSYFVGPPLGYNLVVTLPEAIRPWPPGATHSWGEPDPAVTVPPRTTEVYSAEAAGVGAPAEAPPSTAT